MPQLPFLDTITKVTNEIEALMKYVPGSAAHSKAHTQSAGGAGGVAPKRYLSHAHSVHGVDA